MGASADRVCAALVAVQPPIKRNPFSECHADDKNAA
jgi:hypothetical protein